MRACRQCVHESARLSREICSHAWYSKNCGERQNHRLSPCPLPHKLATHYFLRLTRARGKRYQREGKALFDDFWYFWSCKSTIKEKFLYVSSRVVEAPTPTSKIQVQPTAKIKNIFSIPSAHILDSRPPCIYSGRAGNACTNLLGFFVRYVRTRGIAEAVGSGKTTDFRSVLCRTRLPRKARATNSCTREEISKRGERSL